MINVGISTLLLNIEKFSLYIPFSVTLSPVNECRPEQTSLRLGILWDIMYTVDYLHPPIYDKWNASD